jgi:putative tricarboxylic transport membrane protein
MSELRTKKQGETIFALLLLVFSVTAFWQSYAISGFSGLATAGVFPMLASTIMTVASAFILVQTVQLATSAPRLSENTTTNSESVLPPRVIVVLLLITGYVFAMPMAGFVLASGLFLFFSFSYLWRKSLLISLVLTFASLSSVYVIFRKVFQVVLPKGSLVQAWF